MSKRFAVYFPWGRGLGTFGVRVGRYYADIYPLGGKPHFGIFATKGTPDDKHAVWKYRWTPKLLGGKGLRKVDY